MAIVANLAFPGHPDFPIDKPLWTANRSNAGDPNGSLTPQFAGEIVLDTTNKKLWQAELTTNTSWTTFQRTPNS